MLDLGMINENELVQSVKDRPEDTSRVHTPTPASRGSPQRQASSVPANLPASDDTSAPNEHDSRNDTEPEDGPSTAQPSLGTFSSFHTYHTAATSPSSSTSQLDSASPIPPTPSFNGPGLRRSISADRLTMRPTRAAAPPPLIRTCSEGPNSYNADHTVEATLLTPPGTRVHGDGKGADIISVLNAFCGDHTYLNQPDGPVYGSDTESSDDRQPSKIETIGPPGSRVYADDEPPKVLTAKDKGKGRADNGAEVGYESDGAYLSATSDIDPSPSTSLRCPRRFNFGSNENTDDEIRYDTVSEGISDSEDINISAYIPTTASMPPFPAPTVSRSRSSSRSFPSPAFVGGDVPPVPPLPPFAILNGRTRALSSPRGSPAQDQRSLQTPTPTQLPSAALPPTPSSASISSNTSLSSTAMDARLGSPHSSAPLSLPEKSRQRSVSESGGGSGVGSGSGSGSQSRGRFHQLAQALRGVPSVSSGRGIEHIKPTAGKSKDRPRFTIAFIGSAGCGKTTIIEKASKSANSKFKQEPTRRNVCYGREELTVEFRDVATVVDKTRGTSPISTVEVDSAPLLRALDRGADFWPETLPTIDGVVLCYDASREGNESGSFESIQRLNDAFAALRYPIIWVGCKSDWIRRPKKDGEQPSSPRVLPDGIVPPHEVFVKANQAHTGLIEVAKGSSYGKEQMRNLFTWMYKSTARFRREKQQPTQCDKYLNHASPEVLDRKPSQKTSRSAPPQKPPPIVAPPEPPTLTTPPKSPLSPTALQPPLRATTRARSMSDLLSQEARDRVTETSAAILRKASATVCAAQLPRNTEEQRDSQQDSARGSQGAGVTEHKVSGTDTSVVVLHPKLRVDPFAFMALDDLVVRLSGGFIPGLGMVCVVDLSGFSDEFGADIQFNHDFMMTFRRFATPREMLLAMIRRLRTITDAEEMHRAVLILFDYLLEWTYEYPEDFASPGAIAPFEVLIRMFRDKHSHKGAPKLHQRLDFLRTRTDDCVDWAKPVTDFTEGEESDGEDPDSRPQSSELNRASPIASIKISVSTSVAVAPAPEPAPDNEANEARAGPSTSMLRPKSLFLRRNSMEPPPQLTMPEHEERELRRMAKHTLSMDPEHVAEEITRVDVEIFMGLKVGDLPSSDLYKLTVLMMNSLAIGCDTGTRHAATAILRYTRSTELRTGSNGWAISSFILVLNKVRHRALMFEFWIRVATYLRGYNNFAALHTVVAAMDKVYAGTDGPEIERLVQAGELNWNKFLRAIHTSDIVRVMSNRDHKEGNPQLIHWGKFQIIARIATSMVELQDRIRLTTVFNFKPHPAIAQMLRDAKTMSEEMIVEKTYPSLEEVPPPKPGSAWSARVIRKVLK
ncbi:hypothetical protein FRC10_007179 [Ceratobasidium sp. 414]|nr:hypothetical protein FRC10_007179 [Ceratobasidium sp. 414]